MDCVIFEQKTVVQGKEKSKWFYTFKDPVTNKKRTRICRECKTKGEAQEYVKKLRYLSFDQYLISNIAADMFIDGKDHINRLKAFGKALDERTRLQRRQMIELIIKDFGAYQIHKLKVSDIEKHLLADDTHSGSWKNFYLGTFSKIYDETQWKCDKPVPRPVFMKFACNSKKADLLTTEELNLFVSRRFWDKEQDYVLFLVTVSCGLRIGEARALKASQFHFEEKILVIDGFCKRNGSRTNYNKKGSEEDRKIRIAPLPDFTIKIVKSYLETFLIGADDYLYTMNGHPPRQEYLWNVFRRVIKRCGIKTGDRKIVPHSLRYTFVTRMRRELDVETVKKIAGHSSVKMTEYYTRFTIPEAFESIKESIPVANALFE